MPVAHSNLSSKHNYHATDMLLMRRKKLFGATHLSARQQRIKLNDTIVAAQCYTNATNGGGLNARWSLFESKRCILLFSQVLMES